ncbi:putative acylesterase/phospholipase RssA [Bradyrhizobium sp. AZCC 2262]|uniref:patatin-like phospholipase family protein n=1 Tax=Bradyrhizobium sp. AZCC 2262 TaxID=3117022 RepID=UPI002FF298C7
MAIADIKATPVLVLLGDVTAVPHHAGALAALERAGIDIQWVCGSSGGAISAAIIAGNSPERRMVALLDFWHWYQRDPWVWPQSPDAQATTERRLYDTSHATLFRLVDFDLLNNGPVRMTTLATSVARGSYTFFDSSRSMVTADHILACSLASPDRFSIEINGERYWNDDWLSVTTLQFILHEEARRLLVFVVDPWARKRPFSGEPEWQRARAREIANVTRIDYDIQAIGNNLALGRITEEKRPRPLSAAALDLPTVDIVHAQSNSGATGFADPKSVPFGTPDFEAAMAVVSRAIDRRPWEQERGDAPVAVHTVSVESESTEMYPGRAAGPRRPRGASRKPPHLEDLIKSITRVTPAGEQSTVQQSSIEPNIIPVPLPADLPLSLPADLKGILDVSAPVIAVPERPGLIFKLEGEGDRVGVDEVVWEQPFDLVVDYGAGSDSALTVVTGERLISATSGPSAELGISVAPSGFALREGSPFQTLKFENGVLTGETPRFKLRAPRPADLAGRTSGPCGVFVMLTKANALVHSFFIEIRLVEVLDREAHPAPVIDIDLDGVAASKPEERVATITITNEGAAWQVYWNIDGVQSRPRIASKATPAALKAAYDTYINNDLKQVAESALWRNTDAQLHLPDNAASRDEAQKLMGITASAGYKLHKLFREDEVFEEAIELIEKLPDGSRITVITDDVVFPWELFYPLSIIDGEPKENLQPDMFWGNRFIIESLLIATSSAEKLPSNRQQGGKLHVSMGLNASIDLAPAWKGRDLLPVQFQKAYFDSVFASSGDYAAGYKQVLTAIRRKPPDASLIYFFCHGTADRLEFEASTAFTPYHVDGEKFSNWPVVFINACDAGNTSPLSFLSFRTEFRKRRAAGLIAPSFPIPTLFAAIFAKAFMERYAGKEAVGSILFDLRKKLLSDDNPLGLWYSLQCPLDLKAPG